ncbi:zinc-binding dehydrogenase, partial [Nocardioides sp.]|uniref:zinc-binding dehydrogenase n=1 Tax=Nocardioides sp. TaxID=35761 RepID=UPI00271D8A01
TVLVRGAASAVGTAAVQLAVAAGARVIALAGGADKGQLCLDLGADVALDSGPGGAAERAAVFDAVMDATGDRGVDVVFDPIGGELTETLWTCGTLGGRYLAVGFNDDPESGLTGRPLRKLSMANMTVMGVLLAYLDTPRPFRQFGINAFPPSTGERAHAALLELAAAGRIRPVVGRTVGFEGVAAALEDHAARRTSGRTVVVP